MHLQARLCQYADGYWVLLVVLASLAAFLQCLTVFDFRELQRASWYL